VSLCILGFDPVADEVARVGADYDGRIAALAASVEGLAALVFVMGDRLSEVEKRTGVAACLLRPTTWREAPVMRKVFKAPPTNRFTVALAMALTANPVFRAL
jgi:hypothetical protein